MAVPHHNSAWEFDGEDSKLLALGAPQNVPDRSAVIEGRHARKAEIVPRLHLNQKDHVLDLGSGFLAEVIAPEVARIHCADVSTTFLTDCRERLTHVPNVEFHHITYADLSPLYGKGIIKAYATLLFIHFNFYDLFFYLNELNKVLPIGGCSMSTTMTVSAFR
jgi:cyclopropane fatty-acyl-phospholipid synthase-like methyltransferase